MLARPHPQQRWVEYGSASQCMTSHRAPRETFQERLRCTRHAAVANDRAIDWSQCGTGNAGSSHSRHLPGKLRRGSGDSSPASGRPPESAGVSRRPGDRYACAAPVRSADKSRRRHRYPWAVRPLAMPRESRHSGWHIPQSYQVSSWLRRRSRAARRSGAAAWIRQQVLILVACSAFRHQAEMPGQHPRNSR